MPLLSRKAEGAGVVLPGEDKDLWRSYCSLSTCKGGKGF